ncbi:MAG: site-specific integrase, partial [Muribaculum sp.]|nr:site-specific integrase [Muribaculum sp.]
KLIIREDKNNSVRLRVTNRRKSAQFSLGVCATREELDRAMSADSGKGLSGITRLLRAYRAKIDLASDEIVAAGREDDDAKVIAEIFRNALVGTGAAELPDEEEMCLFMPFFKRCIESKKNEGYRENREYTYRKIREFCPAADRLRFEDVDLKWLNRFDEWMEGEGLKQNTRNIHFKNIRTVINRAIDEELTEKYPFRRFKIRPEATRKRNLRVEELRKLFTCEVEEYQVFYRDMAKLIFMLCGINAVDLYNLEGVTSDGRVEYRRAKTHKLYSIRVEPEAKEIIERWRGERKLLCIAERWSSHKDSTKWLNNLWILIKSN